MAVFGEDLYIVDAQGSYGIQVVSKNGTVRNIIKSSAIGFHISPENCWHPKSVALDKKGNICLSDTGSHRVLKFDPNGCLLVQAGKVNKYGSLCAFLTVLWG